MCDPGMAMKSRVTGEPCNEWVLRRREVKVPGDTSHLWMVSLGRNEDKGEVGSRRNSGQIGISFQD